MIGEITGMIAVVVFWLFLAAVILGPRYMRYRERKNMQDVLRVAYEKGQPVSPDMIAALQADLPVARPIVAPREQDLRRAIVMIAIGIGLCGLGYGLWYGLASASDEAAAIVGGCVAGAGAIPGMIGIAHLILWAMAPKTPTERARTPTVTP
jgi:hypothetical protein